MSLGPPAQFPARWSPQVAGTRTKVALKPGHSLMDWIRLGRTNPDLAGTGGRRLEVTQDELAKHDKQNDAWVAIRGRVFNVTPYLDFHPGGVDELMRGAGKDATSLFDEIHKWVNFDSMLEKCLVGKLKLEENNSVRGPSRRPPARNGDKNLLPPQVPIAPLGPPGPPGVSRLEVKQPPRYEWYQTDNQVVVAIYTKWTNMRHENVVIDRTGRSVRLTLLLEEHIFTVHLELENDIDNGYEVRVQRPSGKVEITMKKSTPGKQWKDIGQPLERNKHFVAKQEAEEDYRCCHLESISIVTHDTRLYCLTLPEGTRMCVPTGHHVHVKMDVEGMEVIRSYTVVRPSLDLGEQDARLASGSVFYLMIKIYADGALTRQLDKLQSGDSLQVSTHMGDFVSSRLESCTQLLMFAAGTGFTPMVGLLYETAVLHPENQRNIHLSFFNKTQDDILWRDHLQKTESKCQRLDVRHILSQPDDKWTGLTGRIRKELLETTIPKPGEGGKVLFCACGPTAFTNEAVRLAKSLGCTDDMIHAFLG